MNTDLSFNHITHRRAGGGGGSSGAGAGGSGGGGDSERYGATYRERFELNQYYNAVEDEQIYMDEYTTLSHRYNEFMMNANAMYMRMEQTLRESLTRAMVRQSFYYHRVQENMAGGGGMGVGMGMGARHDAVPAAVAAAVSAVSAPPQPIQSAPAVTGATARLGEVFPRLLSRYFSTELNRDAREANTGSRRVDAMLYTFPIPRGGGGGGGGSGPPRPGAGAPTNDQIGRATLNTVFSNIISPVNATCPISRDEFDDNSEITMIRGCNHIFNRVSLREWFANHSTCPMCRCDIRLYDPSASVDRLLATPRPREPVVLQPDATNISIDRVDDDSITFSYDLPVEYSNEQIYNDIMNRVMGGRMPQTSPSRHDHGDDHGGDDDDDIMEVD
jgi:hypothetical protein